MLLAESRCHLQQFFCTWFLIRSYNLMVSRKLHLLVQVTTGITEMFTAFQTEGRRYCFIPFWTLITKLHYFLFFLYILLITISSLTKKLLGRPSNLPGGIVKVGSTQWTGQSISRDVVLTCSLQTLQTERVNAGQYLGVSESILTYGTFYQIIDSC